MKKYEDERKMVLEKVKKCKRRKKVRRNETKAGKGNKKKLRRIRSRRKVGNEYKKQ